MGERRSTTGRATALLMTSALVACSGRGHEGRVPVTTTAATSGVGPVSTPRQSSTATTSVLPRVVGQAAAALQFVGSSTGWLVGAERILATRDGGVHWQAQYSGPLNFIGLDAIDTSTAWALSDSALLGTRDGGSTWTALGEPDKPLDSVHFVTSQLGWGIAGGDHPQSNLGVITADAGAELVATTDGGRTWTAPGHAANPQTVCFADSRHGWIGASGGFYRSTDAGHTWTLAHAISNANAKPEGPLVIVQCAGPHVVWALVDGLGAATGHSGYLLYRGSDTGTFAPVLREAFTQFGIAAPDGPTTYPGPISAVDADHAIFVGWSPPIFPPNGVELVAVGPNGPMVGTTLSVPPLYRVDLAAFATPTFGWVVGHTLTQPSGASMTLVVHTIDGGRSWRTQLTLPAP